MPDPIHRWPVALDLATRVPQVMVATVAVLALFGTWHTLSQDFGLTAPVAGLLATVQTVPVAAALRWPLPAVTMSTISLVAATLVARTAGADSLWPDPNLYVHLGVIFLTGMRTRPRWLVVWWLLLVGSGVVLTVAGPETTASPGLAATVGLATVTIVVAGALHARDQAVRLLVEQQRASEAERIRSALLEERTRIARELHDVVAHHMSVVAVQAEAAPFRVSDPPDVLTEAFAAIRTNAVDGLTELRRVVGLLRRAGDEPAAPQPGIDDIGRLVDNVRTAGVRVDTSVLGTPRPLSSGLQLSAFRIVQEALNNAMRHAPGTAVTVELRYAPDTFELAVTNSAPVSAQPPTGSGHGMIGMRERVTMLGGTLDAGPSNGGYHVAAVLPTDGQAPT